MNKLNLSSPYGKFEARKPKARYDHRRRLWIVWDGISFNNGWSQHPHLTVAYNFYLELLVIIAYQQAPKRLSVKPFKQWPKFFDFRKEYIRETK